MAIIGGGSSYTPELIEGLIIRSQELPVGEISLVDIECGKEKLEIIGKLAKRMIGKAKADIKVNTTLNRREAIADADFVLTQFRVGCIEARIRDEKIPLRYDVLGQETTGPGGFAKALRTIPVILDICKDMQELAPKAWLINFTNPSGIVTETVIKHTDVSVIGLCNVPINMQKSIADLMNKPMEKVFIKFVGLNHLLWAANVYYDGEDVTQQLIEEFVTANDSMKNITVANWDVELVRSLGMLPCPYHRYYYMPETMLAGAKESANTIGTRGEIVKELEKELFAIYSDPELDIKPPQLEKRGGALYSDAACNLMSSIVNDKRDIQVVNVRNHGTISDLSDDAVIETNCVVRKDGVFPLNIGRAPLKARGLMQVVKAYEELTVEAGVKGDYDAGLQALVLHPLVPSFAVAKKLMADIIQENADYLPQFT